MRELEDRIAAWRAEMAKAMPGRPDVVAELEEHVRDEVAHQVRAGAPPEQAFDQAIARLGEAGRLAREFQRGRSRWFGGIHSAGMRLTANVAGVLGLVCFVLYVPVLIRVASWFITGVPAKVQVQVPEILFALMASWTVASAAVVYSCGRFLRRPNPRDAQGLVAFNLLVVWMLMGWCVAPLAVEYPTKVALLLIAFAGLLGVRRAWVRHLVDRREFESEARS